MNAVLFDLDATLLDRHQSLLRFALAQYKRYQGHLGHIAPEVYLDRFIRYDQNGRVWKDVVYSRLIAEFDVLEVTVDELLGDYVNRFHEHCVGFTGLHTMLTTLQDDGYQLGLITNGRTLFQNKTIDKLFIRPFFSTILVSETVGIRKPHPAIFYEGLTQLGVVAETAVFVGDSPMSDIAGAQAVGMKAIWKDNDKGTVCPFADAVCHQLPDLPKIITKLT